MNPSYWPRLEPEIRRLAGTMTAQEMANHLGVSYSSLITGASRRKISLAVPGIKDRMRALDPDYGCKLKGNEKARRRRKNNIGRLAHMLWRPTSLQPNPNPHRGQSDGRCRGCDRQADD